jgi:hypothetical protein
MSVERIESFRRSLSRQACELFQLGLVHAPYMARRTPIGNPLTFGVEANPIRGLPVLLATRQARILIERLDHKSKKSRAAKRTPP